MDAYVARGDSWADRRTGIVGPQRHGGGGGGGGGVLGPCGRHNGFKRFHILYPLLSFNFFGLGLSYSLNVQATWQLAMRQIKMRRRLRVYLVDRGPPDPHQKHVRNREPSIT